MSASIPSEVRASVRARAGNRCGYCLSPQSLVLAPLEVDHVLPSACGGTDEEGNLWLACRMCNGFKAAQTDAIDPTTGQRARLFDPRVDPWPEHFRWSEDGTVILGLTQIGRATVLALQLNHLIAVVVRRSWVAAGWHPPPL